MANDVSYSGNQVILWVRITNTPYAAAEKCVTMDEQASYETGDT